MKDEFGKGQPRASDDFAREEQALLPARAVEAEARVPVGSWPTVTELRQELASQATIAGPQYINMITMYASNLVCIATVGHLGELELAAASMSISMYSILGQGVILSMVGALDTQASQAFGAHRFDQLGTIFQRTVSFCMVHCVPMNLMFAALPALLRAMGQQPALIHQVTQYLLAMIPTVYLHSIIRPTNRIMLAQRIAIPQACVGTITLIIHVPITYFAVKWFGLLGAAWAYNLTSAMMIVFMWSYVGLVGLGPRVWGVPSKNAFQGWGPFARLAYSSCAMKCIESWSFGSMVLWAGKLPHPDSAVAATGVVFSVYGFFFMSYGAGGMAICARVGNHLGAGDAHRARAAALVGLYLAPCIVLLTAILLVEPHCQSLLIRGFAGDSASPDLQARLRGLLHILAIMQAFDCVQALMQGVIQGAGRQSKGVLINLVSFYICGLPAAILLSFYFGWDVYGLVSGMALGSFIQAVCAGDHISEVQTA
ncbi:hypothetical protein WJX73_010332 [Symbiochloris irregularis]|uniref:Protein DETOXIFICATION n=1 Tax=Symbiochloris irregularis TaxID=706552 RepID=A0AAW1P8Z8_9CHLO